MQKIILITGASSGLGKATALKLAESGHKVYGTSRNPDQQELTFTMVKLDLQDKTSVDRAVEEIILKEGRIDVLINNAGMGIAGPLADSSMEEVDKIFKINFFGPVYLTTRVIPHMKKQSNGLIINISSIGGLISLPYQGLYSATKYAVEGYSEALRYELKKSGIRVAVVQPGDYRTGFTSSRQIIASTGANDPDFLRSLAVIEKDENGGEAPEKLARCVARIVSCSKPAYHYISGRLDQKFAVFIKRILPSSWFAGILGGHYKV